MARPLLLSLANPTEDPPMTRSLLSTASLLLLAGCFDENLEASAPYCEDVATVITLEEATALGFSGADVLALAEGTFDETLTWTADGSTTPVQVVVSYAEGEVRFVDSEVVTPEGEDGEILDIYVECPDRIEVDVTVAVATEDGGFDEAWDVALSSTDGLTAGGSVSPADFTGTYEYTAMDPSEYDELSYRVTVGFDGNGTSGEAFADAQGCDTDCEGDECTCWDMQDPIASWPLVE